MATVKKPKKTKRTHHPLHPKRVQHLVSRHYFAYMPNKKHHRILVWVVFFVVSIIIAAQLLYPLDRALPLAQVNETKVGWQRDDELAKLFNDRFEKTKIKLTIGKDKSLEYSLKVAGAEQKTQAMIAKVSDYPLWMRYIPLSILFQPSYVTTVDVTYADAILKQFSDSTSKWLSFEPVSARLAIQGEKIIPIEDIRGSQVTSSDVQEALRSAAIKLGDTTIITVPAVRRDATMTQQDFMAVKAKAETVLSKKITISADNQSFSPSRATVASWLQIHTTQDAKATLVIDPTRVDGYLEEINGKVGTPAGRTNITIVNGRETGRTPGTPGRGINRPLLLLQLNDALMSESQRATPVKLAAQFVNVSPSIIYNNKYTATQEGLQAYVTDASHARNVRISIQQLDGGKWAAQARANESTPSASTFKLYVSLMLFDRMKKGEIRWSDRMLDTTVSGCFNRMTIASTNPCAYKWLDTWGRGNVNQFVYAHGFSQGTVFSSTEATRTTAADLTKFMIGLNDGSLVKEPYRSQLLHNLFIHPYQEGIPRGSAGIVHNKVGFLWDYVHDTAIVQHPRGTYVMTVMTKGQSYASIAAITREVERIMYPL